MSSASAATDENEHDRVRQQIINQILYMDQGLRRGLNHDVKCVGDEQDSLVSYFLAMDKHYQLMVRRARFRRCVESAEEADSRKQVFENVIFELCESGGLYYLSGMWSLKPSVTDSHRKAGRHPRRQPLAFNDGSYHGRPRRDRNRLLAHVA